VFHADSDSSTDDSSTNIGIRFSRYLLFLGLLILPVLAFIDIQAGYWLPAWSKLISIVVCLLGLGLSFKSKRPDLIRYGAAVTLLFMSLVGAIYKLDHIESLFWLPVLPILFCFLVGVRHGGMYSLGFILIYVSAYFLYFKFTGKQPIDFNTWLYSLLTFFTALLTIIWCIKQHERDGWSLKQEAEIDYLTGVANRRGFIRRMQMETARVKRYAEDLSLIVMDIDNFKSINDNFGHYEGDQLLQAVVSKTKAQIRQSDLIARWGGEEFVILTPQTNLAACRELAEKLRHSLENAKFSVVGDVTSSYGVTQYRRDENWEDFFQRADTFLYQAKRKGRNCVISDD